MFQNCSVFLSLPLIIGKQTLLRISYNAIELSSTIQLSMISLIGIELMSA